MRARLSTDHSADLNCKWKDFKLSVGASAGLQSDMPEQTAMAVLQNLVGDQSEPVLIHEN